MDETHFSAITLNCFGALAPGTRRRLLALARELDASGASVVCLQEVQTHPNRSLLIDACRAYPHQAFEPFVYAPKGGLLTLARDPIGERRFHLFPERGRLLGLTIADVALHKGALVTHHACAGTSVMVVNTHLSANYRGDWRPGSRHAQTERAQLARLAEIVRAAPPEALVIVMGDFNVPRGSWLYEEFLVESGLADPLVGDTRPTYRLPPGLPARFAVPIDWLLLRAPPLDGLRFTSDLCFVEPVTLGAGAGHLSDHIGVELRLSWRPAAVLQ